MRMTDKIRTRIAGTGSYLPERVLTNQDLEEMVDTSDQWIRERTGIIERRIAGKDEPTSVMAYHAAREAMDNAGITGSDLDLIIVATVTPDMIFPATACLLQDRLGAKNAAAFDLEAGCTGFIYGLAVANQFITGGSSENVLVIGAESLSKITNYEDRSTCVLFGDAAGAAVLKPTSNEAGILATELGSDGSGGDLLRMRGGGSLHPTSKDTVLEKMHFIEMEGNQVFKFAVRAMGKTSEKLLKRAGLKKEELDFLVPHQANNRIIEASARRLKLQEGQILVNLHRYGNTSSASIPLALHEALEQGKIKEGDHVILVGFGAGLTWGGCLLKWS